MCVDAQVQRQSLYEIEAAYGAALALADAGARPWRARVNQGKIVAKYGDRAKQLLASVQKEYFQRTAGCLLVRERAERGRLLEQYLTNIVSSLFQQQVGILELDTNANFKKALINLARSKDAVSSDDIQQELRSALFRFQTAVEELNFSSKELDLNASGALQDLTSTLQAIAKDFPDSNAAKLEALRRMDSQVMKPRSKGRGRGRASSRTSNKKGKRAVQIGLNLVGMLRPPGFGNLQGFVGYNALSLLGLPLELLLGIQNDGDSPEVCLYVTCVLMRMLHVCLILRLLSLYLLTNSFSFVVMSFCCRELCLDLPDHGRGPRAPDLALAAQGALRHRHIGGSCWR